MSCLIHYGFNHIHNKKMMTDTEQDNLALRKALHFLRKKPPQYRAAIPLLEEAALAGQTEAAFLLGSCCLYGLGTHASREQATFWLKRAADKGHTFAHYHLALLREDNGADLANILPIYQALAGKGFSPAQVRLMYHFAEAHNDKQALFWATAAAKQNDPHAQSYLARHHPNNTHPYLLTSYELYQQAAEEGLGAAHWQLANQFLFGQGVEVNTIKARHHFHMAAQAGVIPAKTEYAKLVFSDPLVTDKQIAAALDLLHEAAADHHSEAHALLAQMYLTGRFLNRSYPAATEHAHLAAQSNHAEALRLLGDIHQYGMGVAADPITARSYYQRASKQGDIASRQKLLLADALSQNSQPQQPHHPQHNNSSSVIEYHRRNEKIYRSAFARHYGLGCRQDYAEAARLYQEAALYHHPKAQTNLGLLYYNGQGIKTDASRAAYWFEQAAQQGDAVAQYNLACLYYDGHGVSADHDTAQHWLNAAIENGYPTPQHLQALLAQAQEAHPADSVPQTPESNTQHAAN